MDFEYHTIVCNLETHIGNNVDWKYSTEIRKTKRCLETVKWDWKQCIEIVV